MQSYETQGYPLSGVPTPLWDVYTNIQPAEQTVNDHLLHSIARHVDDEVDRDDLDDDAEEWIDMILENDDKDTDTDS